MDQKAIEADLNWTKLNWDGTKTGSVDIRLFYNSPEQYLSGDKWLSQGDRNPSSWTECRWPYVGEDKETTYPYFYTVSGQTNYPICYSTEALKYAQSGYLVSIVAVQWADLMICKTRNLSLSQQGMINSMGNFGIFFETTLVAILLYVPFLNLALGTRQIPFQHFAVPSFSFYVCIFFYDECRKSFLRAGMIRENGKLKLKGWVVQNTYY